MCRASISTSLFLQWWDSGIYYYIKATCFYYQVCYSCLMVHLLSFICFNSFVLFVTVIMLLLSIENDFFVLVVISRSSEDPNVFLVNDFQDPLQVCRITSFALLFKCFRSNDVELPIALFSGVNKLPILCLEMIFCLVYLLYMWYNF